MRQPARWGLRAVHRLVTWAVKGAGWPTVTILLLEGAAAWAADPVTVRCGEHTGYSRVVFTLPPGTNYRAYQMGELLVLAFPLAGPVPSLSPAPARMLSVSGGMGQAAIGVPSGLHAHIWQIDRRVLVDVFAGQQPAR